MNNQLSTRQSQILSYIRDYIGRKGFPPSVRDIQRRCEISSTSVVDYNLKRLTEKGYIERDYGISRSIRVLGSSQTFRTVPLEGYIERERHPNDDVHGDVTLDVPASIVDGHGTVRAWKVTAPMPEALAAVNDLLLVPENAEPRNGDTVLAWVESLGETVIRRQYREGPTIRLEALDPSYKALSVLASDVSVTGKVVGMLRIY